ncbi:hypothetical protein [Brevundimonas pishanensis]|uniref:hypothetical protein n=1 Tax=Brevundimonas pishanensis TaxID=2896315 RepID=UPI001FA6C3BD|nr:hypothetical protein [Brevundimonas pishanensis]
MKKSLILAAAALAAMTVSACGKMADLEAPGARPTTNSRWTERNREPATVLSPNSQNPIDGGPADPTGRRPQY